MIELTYIFHSGFLLESDRCILVFDYWMDPMGIMPKRIARRGDKHLYVLASHFHEDHFNREIFDWRSRLGSDVTYILSKDILRHRRAGREEADVWMAKGATWTDGRIKVTATGSNDSGVSWMVEVDGRRIFHAGDLCNWYARFLADGTPDGEIHTEEFGTIDPVAEEKRFLGELKDIRKRSDSFDIVMFPVDGRIGNGYTLGARQFIERFRVGLFVPMHFVMSGFESAWRMEPFCQERNIPFWRIGREGDSVSLQDDWTGDGRMACQLSKAPPAMNQDSAIYRIWIGGSCDYGHRERAGGAAAVIEQGGGIISRDVISDLHTTEFRMMLTLMIRMMRELPAGSSLLFLTNAAYIQNFDKTPSAKSANPDLILQCISEKQRHASVSVRIVPYHKSPLLIEAHDMATEAMTQVRRAFRLNPSASH